MYYPNISVGTLPFDSHYAAAAAAKLLQLCPTLCDPIDGSPPGSPIPGTLQARTLEWVAISFSNAGTWKVKVKSLSRVWLLATPCTTAYLATPSMGFSRQEYWSRVPLPSPFLVLSVPKYRTGCNYTLKKSFVHLKFKLTKCAAFLFAKSGHPYDWQKVVSCWN